MRWIVIWTISVNFSEKDRNKQKLKNFCVILVKSSHGGWWKEGISGGNDKATISLNVWVIIFWPISASTRYENIFVKMSPLTQCSAIPINFHFAKSQSCSFVDNFHRVSYQSFVTSELVAERLYVSHKLINYTYEGDCSTI